MEKIINDTMICFYDNDELTMYIDYSMDECVWCFNTDKIIKITKDMELYWLLDSFMNEDYIFGDDEILKCYKDKNKLVWYSDCYYDPDNEMSISMVSKLNVERKDGYFNIWCTKELDKIINRNTKTYVVSFSPSFNGRYTRNINSGLTLQDDFVILIYLKLLSKNKVLKK